MFIKPLLELFCICCFSPKSQDECSDIYEHMFNLKVCILSIYVSAHLHGICIVFASILHRPSRPCRNSARSPFRCHASKPSKPRPKRKMQSSPRYAQRCAQCYAHFAEFGHGTLWNLSMGLDQHGSTWINYITFSDYMVESFQVNHSS